MNPIRRSRRGRSPKPDYDRGIMFLVLLLTNIVAALLWPIFVPIFGSLDYVLGYVVGLAFLTLIERSYSRQHIRITSFLLYALWEIIMSSIQLTWILIQPRSRFNAMIQTAIVGVPLTVSSELEIAILAHLITLTPGTLSVELDPNAEILYIHTLNYKDTEEFRRIIKQGFEHRLLQLTRGIE